MDEQRLSMNESRLFSVETGDGTRQSPETLSSLTIFSNFVLSDDFLVNFKNLLEHSQGKITVMG